MKQIINEKTIELAKQFLLEMGRLALLAALPVLIVAFEDGVLSQAELRMVYAIVIVTILKSIDRALHNTKVMEKGLTRF